MPNFDTGHYFLTTMAPIKNGTTLDDRGVSVSYEQNLRAVLAILPTALQSPATENIGLNSPFARNGRTHLCRFMVLDDVVYNGRIRRDALATALADKDPLIPQQVDRLNCAYLMFVADIDAILEDGGPLPATLLDAEQDAVRDAYARKLWETMAPEIGEIYRNCVGFDGVNNADAFADYISRCQIKTTMPFNDYWLHAPTLNRLPIFWLAALVLIPLAVMLLGGIGWALHMASVPILGWIVGWTPGWTLIGGLLATGLAIFIAYAYVMWNGMRPMPPGEYADLPSVLKSLYLQQTFSEFAISAQGVSDEDLHAAFGEFVREHKPDDKTAPSQRPGVVSIAREGAVSK